MIASSLGISRSDPLDEFTTLRFGVRTDQPGQLLDDFQTTRTLDGVSLPLSHRFYLSDAVFLAGIESDNRNQLQKYGDALHAPQHALFLGRRSCPPDGPMETWIVDTSLEAALTEHDWLATETYQRRHRDSILRLPISCDTAPNASSDDSATFTESKRDVPISFDPRRRRYGIRSVTSLSPRIQKPKTEPLAIPDHDPMENFDNEDLL